MTIWSKKETKLKKNVSSNHFQECTVKGFAMVFANLVKNNIAEKLQNSGFSVEVGTNLYGHQIFAQVGKRTLVFFCMEKRTLPKNGKHAHRHSQISSRQVAEAYLEERMDCYVWRALELVCLR